MDERQPASAELMQAIVALHAFIETGLQRTDTKIDVLRSDMNERFDWVYDVLDEMKSDTNARFEKVDVRFDRVDKRFEDMDGRFDRVDGDLTEIAIRVARLEIHPA